MEPSVAHMEPQVCELTLSLKIIGAGGSKHIEMKTISIYISLTPRSSLATGLKLCAFPSRSYSK